MRIKHLLIPSLFSCFILVGCDGAEDRKLSYIEQAEESFEKKDYDKAKLGYKNAIQIDPKDVDARIGLAKTMVADQDWRGAAGQYAGVLEIDETHRKARLELGKLFLLARASEQAQEHADYLLAKAPDDIEALTLQAGILAQKNEIDSALEILEAVYNKAEDNIDTAVLYASLLVNSQNWDRAIEVVKNTQSKVNDSVDLHSILVRVYALQKNHELAIAELKKIIEFRPEVFEHKQKLVQYYASINRTEQAASLLEQVIAESEDDGEAEQAMNARQALVDLYIKTRDFERAQVLLDAYIEAYPKAYDLQLGKARLKEGLGEKGEAKSLLNKLIDDDKGGPTSVVAQIELARIEVSEGNVDVALEWLNSVLEEKPSTIAALRLRGQIAATQGRYESAVNDFRIVLKSDPDDANVQRALAETHFKADQFRLAETYLKQLHRRFPQDLAVSMALAEVNAKLGNVDTAIALREEVLLYAPANTANLIELAKLYANTKNIDGLSSAAELLQNTEDGALSGIFFEGLAFQAKNLHQKAIETFDKALEINPRAIEPVSAKVRSLIALDLTDQAITWLDSLAKAGDNALASNLLGETLLLSGKTQESIAAFSQAISISSQWLTPYRNKASAYKSLGFNDKALDALRAALKANPDAVSLKVEVAQLLEVQGDIDGAIRVYEEIYTSSSDSLLAANNLAMLLVTYRDDATSLERAGQVAESLRGSTNPLFMDTLGWVYAKQGQFDLAIPLIEEAVKRKPDIPQINFHLGYAYNQKQDFEKAQQYLARALDNDYSFVGRAKAEALLEQINSRG